MKLLSFVHILFVVSPYPVDLVGHIGRNKAMQQYLVVESLCVPQLYYRPIFVMAILYVSCYTRPGYNEECLFTWGIVIAILLHIRIAWRKYLSVGK